MQPKFEGNALDFGMVIPTPSKPKLDPAPRDFFKHLAVFTLLKKRVQPQSKLLPVLRAAGGRGGNKGGAMPEAAARRDPGIPSIRILETFESVDPGAQCPNIN